MKASDELHQLIRSMSMSEKRHFKIYSSRHVMGDGNNYLRLFDAIAAQDRYDETAIRMQFRDSGMIRHFPSEKHHLYRHVLESLNAFNRNKTFLSRYASILTSVELLYSRGLFAQARRLLKRSRAEAYSLEKFTVLLLLLRWETIIYIKDEDEKNLDRNMEEELRILEVIRVQYALMRVAFNIQIQIDKGNTSARFVREQERKLKKALPASEKVSSFWAKYYYHSSVGLLSSISRRNMSRYQAYKEIKLLMDTSPQFIRDLPGIYHLNLSNLAHTMFLLKKYSEAGLLLGQQRMFMTTYGIKHPALARIVFFNTNESELFLYYKTGQYDKASELVSRIEGEVRKTDVKFSPLLFDLLFMMAVAGLMSKNYKAATRWLNRILNAERVTSFRKELQINARLLYLVVLYESDDVLFESRYNAARRFLQQEKQYRMHRNILAAIRLVADRRENKRSQLRKLIAEIRKEWKAVNADALNKQFDFAGWLESRAAG
ncbi:MAG: hypothetical protein AB1458_13955 [Bacteroidota bacterium]